MTSGFQRIRHGVGWREICPRAQTVGKCSRLSWFGGDEIYRSLGGKLIWLRGDQGPCYLWSRRAGGLQDNAEGHSSKEMGGEKRKPSQGGQR